MSEFKKLSRSVAGLTVLVTGAASGMGRATARVFAAESANVAVTDYAAEGAQAVAAEIAAGGGTAKAWKLDVADRDDIKAGLCKFVAEDRAGPAEPDDHDVLCRKLACHRYCLTVQSGRPMMLTGGSG